MSTSNNKFLSLQCLSNLFLNVSMLGASTTFSGKLFHKFAICKLKKFRLMLVLDNFVLSAKLCPGVFDSLSSKSEFAQLASYKLCNILQVSIIETTKSSIC